MTTITDALHIFWIFHGSIRLNPPKVTPDNKIGTFTEPLRRCSAFPVASSPSTVIQSVLSWCRWGPFSQTAKRGAYLTLSSVLSGKGPSSIPMHLETGLMFEDAPWSKVEESSNHFVSAERGGDGSGFYSKPDLLRATVSAEAYYSRV
jgi:hypothetical protein